MTKEQIYSNLNHARIKTLSILEPYNEGVLFRIPPGHTWSGGMVLDHLRILDQQITAVLLRLSERAKKLGAGKPPENLTSLRDLEHFENQVMGAPTAPGMEPRDPLPTSIYADAELARSGLLQALEKVWSVDCQDFRFPHPWIGPMNAYEWLIFLAVHERGHHEHLQELLNSANHF